MARVSCSIVDSGAPLAGPRVWMASTTQPSCHRCEGLAAPGSPRDSDTAATRGQGAFGRPGASLAATFAGMRAGPIDDRSLALARRAARAGTADAARASPAADAAEPAGRAAGDRRPAPPGRPARCASRRGRRRRSSPRRERGAAGARAPASRAGGKPSPRRPPRGLVWVSDAGAGHPSHPRRRRLSPTSASTASGCARRPSCGASAPSRFRRPTRTSGSARAPNGHLQATGRDARGRKQYRYHPDWRLATDADKFERMLEFGAALPRIRKRVARRPRRAGRHDAAARDGAGDDRSPARHHLRAHRQRGIRAQQPLVRPDDAAQPPRRRVGQPRCACAFAARAARSTRSPSTIRASPASSGAARRCRARSCSSTSTRTARRAPSARPTSTTTSATPAAPTSRPRTSAPGTARRTRCAVDRAVRRRARARGRARRSCSPRSRKRLGNTVAVCRKSYVHPRVLEALAQPRSNGRAARARSTGRAPRRPERRRAPPARFPGARAERLARLPSRCRRAYTITYRSVDDVSLRRSARRTRRHPVEEPLVRVSDSGSVRTLALNRPQALNSFTGAMHGELRAALDAAAADRGVRCVVAHRHRPRLLRRPGSGRSGGRAEPRRRRRRRPTSARRSSASTSRWRCACARCRCRSSPPSTASPPAPARTSRCCCDIVVAARSASFIQAFVQDRPGSRLRRHLAAAAPGRPRQRARPGDARRQARRRGRGSASA